MAFEPSGLVQPILVDFVAGELSKEEFASWALGDPELLELVGQEIHSAILATNFQLEPSVLDLKHQLSDALGVEVGEHSTNPELDEGTVEERRLERRRLKAQQRLEEHRQGEGSWAELKSAHPNTPKPSNSGDGSPGIFTRIAWGFLAGILYAIFQAVNGAD